MRERKEALWKELAENGRGKREGLVNVRKENLGAGAGEEGVEGERVGGGGRLDVKG